MCRFLPAAVLLAVTVAAVLAEEDYAPELGERGDFSFPDLWGPPRRREPWGSFGSWDGGEENGRGYWTPQYPRRRPTPFPATHAPRGGSRRPKPTPAATRRTDDDDEWGWEQPPRTNPRSTTTQASRRADSDGSAQTEGGACGRTTVFPRVVGGEEASLGQFPWQAALMYRRGSGPESIQCGGALVSPRYVVTAAHCLHTGVTRDWRLSKVRLGEWDRRSPQDCDLTRCAPPPEDFSPEATILHPSFSPATPGGGSTRNEGDIALVRLDRAAPYNDFVRPVCLPWNDPEAAGDLGSQTLLVAGWGRTETAEGSERLLFASVPAVPLAECSRRLRVTLSATQLCAGADGRDACKGDSGGPLLRVARTPDDKDNFYELVGIVSFGPESCGSPNMAGAYTRVAAFLPWLRQNMRS